jgi:hypothetical protein
LNDKSFGFIRQYLETKHMARKSENTAYGYGTGCGGAPLFLTGSFTNN